MLSNNMGSTKNQLRMGVHTFKLKKWMHGFPQAGLLEKQLLEEWLSKHGYVQSKITPGL